MKITMTCQELARLLGVSTDSVYTMVRQNRIPHIRVMSRILFHRDVIDSWLRGNLTNKNEEWQK